jgi:hypothetical protein
MKQSSKQLEQSLSVLKKAVQRYTNPIQFVPRYEFIIGGIGLVIVILYIVKNRTSFQKL